MVIATRVTTSLVAGLPVARVEASRHDVVFAGADADRARGQPRAARRMGGGAEVGRFSRHVKLSHPRASRHMACPR